MIPVFFVLCAPLLADDAPPAAPPASSYAPVADLLTEVDYFLGRTSESLADPAAFDLAKQSRARKDAHTLAALGLVLAMHDQDFPQKRAMPALVRGAQQLAAAEADFDAARAALEAMQAARAGHAEPGAAARWERVASLAALMKQVPLIHAQLKRGTDGNRLARQAAPSAAHSAALAAIAQASMVDAEYAKTPEEVQQWQEYCAAMRDAAGEVNAAIHGQQKERVATGMQRMLQSCEACHATFRQQ